MSVDHPSLDVEVLVTCEVFHNDVRYRVNSLKLPPGDPDIIRDKPKRSQITFYSEKSKKRYKFILRNTQHIWTHEMEVGYPADYPRDGLLVKKHRKLLVESLMRKYPGINWTWRQGFQKRGAPHLHFLTDRFVDYKWLAERWAGIVGTSDPSHIKAGTHVDKIRNIGKMIHYMVNYMADDKETMVPEGYENCGRFWGVKRGTLELERFQKILPQRLQGRSMRLFKRWYQAELRSWGIYKWRPGVGMGFTAIGGRRLFDFLMKLKIERE